MSKYVPPECWHNYPLWWGRAWAWNRQFPLFLTFTWISDPQVFCIASVLYQEYVPSSVIKRLQRDEKSWKTCPHLVITNVFNRYKPRQSQANSAVKWSHKIENHDLSMSHNSIHKIIHELYPLGMGPGVVLLVPRKVVLLVLNKKFIRWRWLKTSWSKWIRTQNLSSAW